MKRPSADLVPTHPGRHSPSGRLGDRSSDGHQFRSRRQVVGDIHLVDGRVWLHDNERWREPRWGELTPWGIKQVSPPLRRRHRTVEPEPSTDHVRQGPVSTAVGATLSSTARISTGCRA